MSFHAKRVTDQKIKGNFTLNNLNVTFNYSEKSAYVFNGPHA